MSFDSITYLYFLPAVWLLYLVLNRRWQNLMLVGASYLFYGSWDVRFLYLIIISTAVDYCCALLIANNELTRRQFAYAASSLFFGLLFFILLPSFITHGPVLIDQPKEIFWVATTTVLGVLLAPLLNTKARQFDILLRKKIYLILSLTTNLGILGFFKYFDFFIGGAEEVFRSFGVENVELLHLNIVLPVGISFYTFQTLSYTLGVYRGELKPTKDYVSFSLFVAFFPQLVAGPIERASHLLPILTTRREVTYEHIRNGAFLILLGLFKKVGISNGLAGSVDSIYNSAGYVSTLDVAAATVLFAFQIYCDFSGYSDIARGSARLFGIRLMRNFEQPYFSTNPSEFWRRWHISLSSWLRDYLYISLGGNRKGNLLTYRNLMLTMVLGGLWHGAAMNFVLWGFYQGSLLCLHRYLTRARGFLADKDTQLLKFFYLCAFFIFTCYGWLLFRANSLDQIVTFTSLLTSFDFSISVKRPTFSAMLGLPILLVIDVYVNRTGYSNPFQKSPAYVQGVVYAACLFVVFMGLSNSPTQFIYFQF